MNTWGLINSVLKNETYLFISIATVLFISGLVETSEAYSHFQPMKLYLRVESTYD